MKTINVVFEDQEYALLVKHKGARSWHDFILECAGARNAEEV